jgi:hypothetical protein
LCTSTPAELATYGDDESGVVDEVFVDADLTGAAGIDMDDSAGYIELDAA